MENKNIKKTGCKEGGSEKEQNKTGRVKDRFPRNVHLTSEDEEELLKSPEHGKIDFIKEINEASEASNHYISSKVVVPESSTALSSADEDQSTTANNKPSGSNISFAGNVGPELSANKGVLATSKSSTSLQSSIFVAEKGNGSDRRKEIKYAKKIMGRANTGANVKASSLEWAKSILSTIKPNATKTRVHVAEEKRENFRKESSKRLRSKDEGQKQAKKPREDSKLESLDKTPLSQLLKMDLKVCIVDESDPNWKISADNFSTVENYIYHTIMKQIEEKPNLPIPEMVMSEKFRGFIVITCDSQFSVDFLKATISSIREPWSGAKLNVKTMKEIPTWPRAFIAVTLKDSPGFEKSVLTMLKISNNWLDTTNWRLIKKEKEVNRRILCSFRIDQASKKLIDERKGLIRFGMRPMKCKIQDGKTGSEEITDVANALKEEDIADLTKEELAEEDDDDSMSSVSDVEKTIVELDRELDGMDLRGSTPMQL